MHPDLLDLGFFTIHWYGVMMALAFVVGIANSIYLGRKDGKSAALMSDLGCWIMIAGVAGSRMAHVAANWSQYADHPVRMLYVHQGGLIYQGGFVAAGFGILLFARMNRENPLHLMDIIAASAPLAHAFGRVGCLLNGCCFGRSWDGVGAIRYPLLSTVGWAQHRSGEIVNEYVRNLMLRFHYEHIDRQQFGSELAALVKSGLVGSGETATMPVHAVQLYEAGLDVVLYLVLMCFVARPHGRGSVAALYMALYGVIRFNTEFARGDERMMLGSLTVAQAVSGCMFVAGSAIFIWIQRYGKKTDSAATGNVRAC